MTELSPDPVSRLLAEGMRLLETGKPTEAAERCRAALAQDPKRPQAHFLVGLVATALGDLPSAVRGFGSAAALDPANAAARAQLARTFLRLGRPANAEEALAEAAALAPEDGVVQDLIGLCYSLLGDQATARGWYVRAYAQAPDHAPFAINLASADVFLGHTEEAGRVLDRLLATAPGEAQGQWLLSSLRKATDRFRADFLMQEVDRARDPHAVAFLAYAAGKELEDLEEWDDAFAAFARGAAAKRSVIDYDEAKEVAYFDALRKSFNADWLARAGAGRNDPSPIFVIGQPRTGTTLIERIIVSHSAVESAGELQQFGLSVRRLSGPVRASGGGDRFSPEAAAASARLDPAALGREYLRASAPMRGGAARFVDKLPGNYRYVPLILAALPEARIVHLTRHPADSCFSSFKQLFAEAYHHSYDLAEMARHHVRYASLMEHWRTEFPERFLDVSYEGAVAETEATARRLIEFLGLHWEDACLDFYRSGGAVATASAVQVREKPHTRSVGRWRAYRKHVAPMLHILEEAQLMRPEDDADASSD